MERSLGRHNRTALGQFSLPDWPDNRGVIDRIIGSLSSLRKRHDDFQTTPVWLTLQTSFYRVFESLELIRD